MKRMMTGLIVMLLCGAATAATYEETFTPKANKAYSEDINVWVYTKEFAERFGMPAVWIDEELKGAYAVAFRVQRHSRRTMFPHKGPDVSMLSQDCILDVFIPSNAPIPWVDDRLYAKKYFTPESPQYLRPQTDGDLSWKRRPIGIESPGKKARRPLIRLDEGTLFMREYDKALYPGVVYISLYMGCMEPPKRGVLVEFCADEPWQGSKCHALHEIHIPQVFMQKLHAQWYEKTGRDVGKQWSEIIE